MFTVDLSTRKWDGHVVVALSIMDLAALAFIDSSGVTPLVLRVLAIADLVDDFSVHASAEEAAANARRSRQVVVPLRRPRILFRGCGDDK